MSNTSPSHATDINDKDGQIDILLKERERCQNELQKLKDIVGFADVKNGGDFRTRDSYLPETGPLYDTVRELQHFMFKKVAEWPTINEGVEGECSISESRDDGPSSLFAASDVLCEWVCDGEALAPQLQCATRVTSAADFAKRELTPRESQHCSNWTLVSAQNLQFTKTGH